MKIKRDNYESYFLDYLEGNLEEGVVDEFIDFLQKNPDLKKELQQVGTINLPIDDVLFEGKEKLYKHKFDAADEFNKAAVAWMEGDLTSEEKEEFETWLDRHPDMKQELTLFEYTRLQADTNIKYSNKNRLYHRDKLRTIIVWSTRIAAVFILAFLVFRIIGDMPGKENISEHQVIITENKLEKPEEAVDPKNEKKEEKPAPAVDKSATSVQTPKKSSQPDKSLRENNKGRMDHEKVAQARIPVEIPEKISPRNANLVINEVIYASLEPVRNRVHYEQPEEPAGRLLGDAVREKAGMDNLTASKVAKAGLSLVATLSGEKFSYETNHDGQITELSYESRLLAFSIPTNHNR